MDAYRIANMIETTLTGSVSLELAKSHVGVANLTETGQRGWLPTSDRPPSTGAVWFLN